MQLELFLRNACECNNFFPPMGLIETNLSFRILGNSKRFQELCKFVDKP